MVLLAGRVLMILIVFLMGTPLARALDFDREISRQEKSVQVNYKGAPHSISYFLTQYPVCKSERGSDRSRCNIKEAQRRYNAYRQNWEAERRHQMQAEVAGGEVQVQLERRTGDSL